MQINTWTKDNYLCTTDKSLLQIDIIHQFLIERSYWAKWRTLAQVVNSIKYSESFGIYNQGQQSLPVRLTKPVRQVGNLLFSK